MTMKLLLLWWCLTCWLNGALCGEGLACEEGGYCSVGKLKPYIGDIHGGKELREACEARSYKKEIILMAATGSYLIAIMQAAANLERLGLQHIMIMGFGENDCTAINEKMPQYGCVWDHFRLPMVGKDIRRVVKAVPLWHNRWRTMARAVHLGYNVLSSDTDVIFFDDPYRYFKSPPFADYTIINQPEVLFNEADYRYVKESNGGLIYVQNASPSGPAAWLTAEISDRVLRFIDSNFTKLYEAHIRSSCDYMDQDCLNDVITDVMAGMLLFRRPLTRCRHVEGGDQQGEALRQQGLAATDPYVRGKIQSKVENLPKFMHLVAGGTTSNLRFFHMMMPHNGGVWNESLGGNLYGDYGARGPLSQELLDQIHDDCPECPMWPDPEDPSTQEVARRTPREKYLWAPPFFIFGYYPRGRHGWWHKEVFEGQGPKQVIGHLHYIPGAGLGRAKHVARMTAGHWEWELAREMNYGGNTSMLDGHVNTSAARWSTQEERDHALPKLIALHPDIRLDHLNNMVEYQELLVGLLQVAMLSNRTFVIPALPCSVKFLQEHQLGTDPCARSPLCTDRSPIHFFPHYPSEPSRGGWLNASLTQRETMLCTWFKLAEKSCFDNGVGMLAVEFEKLIEWHNDRLKGAMLPSLQNTIFMADEALSEASSSAPAAHIMVVRASDVKDQARDMEGQAVVYLGHPVQVGDAKYYDIDICADKGVPSEVQRKYGCCPGFSRSEGLKLREGKEGGVERWVASLDEHARLKMQNEPIQFKQ